MNTCATCLYWQNNSCHRYPPALVFDGKNIRIEIPRVVDHFWCGEWKDKDQGANVFATMAQHAGSKFYQRHEDNGV